MTHKKVIKHFFFVEDNNDEYICQLKLAYRTSFTENSHLIHAKRFKESAMYKIVIETTKADDKDNETKTTMHYLKA